MPVNHSLLLHSFLPIFRLSQIPDITKRKETKTSAIRKLGPIRVFVEENKKSKCLFIKMFQ